MSIEETNRDFDQLLVRYLSGELNPEELSNFRAELESEPGKQKLLDEYRKIWGSTVQPPAVKSYDLDSEWALLRKKLPGWDEGKNRSLLYYTYRIAAVLLVGLLVTFSWIYLSPGMGTRVIAENEPVELVLDDGTTVILNRDSRLRYNRKFAQQERKVQLSGEAWFDVSRDTSKPFIVDAGAAFVEVLGTSFNVNAYKKNPVVEITVESGLVSLSPKQDRHEQIIMKAGSGGTFHKAQGELKLIPASDPNAIAWKTRELIFEGSTLIEVTDLLNRVYGVHIVIMNQELASCLITVTFRDQTLEAILNVLEQTLDLNVSRYEDEIRLDGEGCAA